MLIQDIARREIGADELRPGVVLDAAARIVDAVSGAVTRWLWLRAYKSAERRYWPTDKGAA